MFTHFKVFCVLLYLFGTSIGQNLDENIINISLVNYDPKIQNNQIFDTFIKVTDKNVVINVTDVPYKDIEFYIIQVHSYKYNSILSYNDEFILPWYVNGTNIGLFQLATESTNIFYIKNEQIEINNTIYLAVIPYKRAPVPGGCNMEFMTEIAPYQRLKFDDSLVTVDAQMASFGRFKCESQIVEHTLYQMYLPETDFSQHTYFENIKKMLTVKNITNIGTQVSRPRLGLLRNWYNAYKGTGSVYVIIATANGSQVAYVPIVSYACDINNPTENCDNLTTTLSKLLCSSLVFIGLFTCFYGHLFFKTEMFLVGSIVGAYITYLNLSFLEDFDQEGKILTSLAVGIFFGVIWLGFWCYFAIPIVSTSLSLFVLGFLIACVAFYSGIDDFTIVNNEITYWGFFLSIVLLCMTVFVGFMEKANILACAIVGSYAFIIPLDHYLGSNLKYIFINVCRRLTVENYYKATINPPFQIRDLFMTIVWLCLALSGAFHQFRQQRGKPPFPPSPRLHQQPPNERTPLLIPTSAPNRLILIHPLP